MNIAAIAKSYHEFVLSDCAECAPARMLLWTGFFLGILCCTAFNTILHLGNWFFIAAVIAAIGGGVGVFTQRASAEIKIGQKEAELVQARNEIGQLQMMMKGTQ